ncbi:MAG: MotA/TolQ/ExbB proton channel family protein [Bacteroidota bacterium]
MISFLIEGGPIITFPLTLMLILALLMIARSLILNGKIAPKFQKSQILYIKYLGVLALTLGIFGQVIGLYGAFTALEQSGDVAPAMIYGGIKVSSLTTIYGFAIFLLCYTSYILLKLKVERAEARASAS